VLGSCACSPISDMSTQKISSEISRCGKYSLFGTFGIWFLFLFRFLFEYHLFHLLRITLHNVMHLLQLVGKPLLAAELILFQGQDELLIVLDSVRVEFV